MLPEFDLTGKTVLITGAGRGIGKGIALAFAEAGADVAVTSLTEANATRVAEAVRGLGRRGLGYAADSTRLAEMEGVAQKLLGEFGHLDTLINCVGDAIPGPLAPLPDRETRALDEAGWHSIIDINLTQAFTGCRAFGPHLLERRRGSVINISSFAAMRARPNMAAYAAGKAGLNQLTQALALEWAPYGIRVNCIAPGFFPDPEQVPPEQRSGRERDLAQGIPLGRVGQLREVGLVAAFFASEASAYITGQTIYIDGGATL